MHICKGFTCRTLDQRDPGLHLHSAMALSHQISNCSIQHEYSYNKTKNKKQWSRILCAILSTLKERQDKNMAVRCNRNEISRRARIKCFFIPFLNTAVLNTCSAPTETDGIFKMLTTIVVLFISCPFLSEWQNKGGAGNRGISLPSSRGSCEGGSGKRDVSILGMPSCSR